MGLAQSYANRHLLSLYGRISNDVPRPRDLKFKSDIELQDFKTLYAKLLIERIYETKLKKFYKAQVQELAKDEQLKLFPSNLPDVSLDELIADKVFPTDKLKKAIVDYQEHEGRQLKINDYAILLEEEKELELKLNELPESTEIKEELEDKRALILQRRQELAENAKKWKQKRGAAKSFYTRGSGFDSNIRSSVKSVYGSSKGSAMIKALEEKKESRLQDWEPLTKKVAPGDEEKDFELGVAFMYHRFVKGIADYISKDNSASAFAKALVLGYGKLNTKSLQHAEEEFKKIFVDYGIKKESIERGFEPDTVFDALMDLFKKKKSRKTLDDYIAQVRKNNS